MAFNWKTFRTRTLTAIIFAAVMLAGLLWNQWSFLVLFSIIHFGCWWEYFNLIERIYSIMLNIFLRLGIMLFSYGLVLFFCDFSYSIGGYQLNINFSWLISLIGFVLLIIGIIRQKQVKIKAFVALFVGIFYISLSIGMLLGFHGIESGIPLIYSESNWYLFYFPIFIIGCMWVNDTMAYIVGSLIGRTPLSTISPKKTWEGTIGGIILSTLIMGSLNLFIEKKYSFHHSYLWWICLALIAVIAGTFGDLLESKLKRMAGVKDSGSIMPGHGGFLDRFDSLLLAIPAVWLFVVFFI